MHRSEAPPRLISWNITLRCPLKCAHCYVDAGEHEAEGVLSTEEAKVVIDQIAEVGRPIVVLSGGEPLEREDTCEIARYGTERGLRMVMGTSGYLLDHKMAEHLKTAGISAVAISLDSTDPVIHDTFRGVHGAWEKAVSAIDHCHAAGIRVQINMTVVQPKSENIDSVIRFGTRRGVKDFHLFFPVHTGRGETINLMTPEAYEALIRHLLTRYQGSGINIRPTCAPQFRRIADELGVHNAAWGRGCLAGITYCRIYATGIVTPCPYLPVAAGDLRTTSFKEIWYASDLFIALRNPDNLTGKCGHCTYKTVCGGCRARAYQGHADTRWCDGLMKPQPLNGEIFAEDPWCFHQPGGVIQ
ncbi:radical SAM/SPASM domain-containing protein [Methanocalculus sp.]|uniref:radical SAM/SPASM domain-containing protein n=1 Tax=Methanocalculus sp. TaxID=2004547 RepID=UPI0027176334|nr:radical SAM protein [Methanocalculus sp.]MDO8841551.1 radical SAM protein [Methanocalculus sp.]